MYCVCIYILYLSFSVCALCVYIHLIPVILCVCVQVEQDMAMGTDAQGDPVSDPLRDMMPCLFDRNIQ